MCASVLLLTCPETSLVPSLNCPPLFQVPLPINPPKVLYRETTFYCQNIVASALVLYYMYFCQTLDQQYLLNQNLHDLKHNFVIKYHKLRILFKQNNRVVPATIHVV